MGFLVLLWMLLRQAIEKHIVPSLFLIHMSLIVGLEPFPAAWNIIVKDSLPFFSLCKHTESHWFDIEQKQDAHIDGKSFFVRGYSNE